MTAASRNRKRVIAFVAILCVCVIVAFLPPVREHLTMDWVNAQFGAIDETLNRSYGPPIFMAGTFLVIMLQIPGVVPVIVGPLVYGLGEAFFYTMIGVNVGMIATFLVARYFLRDYFAPRLETGRFRRLTGQLQSNGILAMTLLRVALWMFPPMNWLVGATNIRIRDYVIGNIIGLAPVIFALQLTVSRLQSVRSFWDLLRPETIGVLLAFVIFVLLVFWIRRKYFPTREPGSLEGS